MTGPVTRIICAWCLVELRKGGGGPVSHGICDCCAHRVLIEDRPSAPARKGA